MCAGLCMCVRVHVCVAIRYIQKEEKEEKGLLSWALIFRDGTIHTREHRKETSSNSYLHFESAHPRHTFAAIRKSQLYIELGGYDHVKLIMLKLF